MTFVAAGFSGLPPCVTLIKKLLWCNRSPHSSFAPELRYFGTQRVTYAQYAHLFRAKKPCSEAKSKHGERLRCGLFYKKCFREIRMLTRYLKKVVGIPGSEKSRLYKTLESVGIKPGSFVPAQGCALVIIEVPVKKVVAQDTKTGNPKTVLSAWYHET